MENLEKEVCIYRNPDYFPKLRFDTLKAFFTDWLTQKVCNYSGWETNTGGEADSDIDIYVRRITLHNQMTLIPGPRYLVYVDIENDEPRKLFNRTWTGELFNLTIKSPRFKEVYKEPPSQNYHYEWAITTQLPPGIDEKYSWVLFSHTEKEKTTKEETAEKDPDDFIRNLTISYENDYEIKIQVPRKKAELFKYNNLGFKSAVKDEWQTLLGILKGSNTYYVGRAGGLRTDTRKKYEREQGLIKRINKKLIEFLHKEFSLQISKGFKTYELYPEKGPGWYKFKFETISTETETKSRFDKYTKKQLLDHFKRIFVTFSQEPADYLRNEIEYIRNLLIEKHGMDNKEIYDFCNATTDKEEIYGDISKTKYDPYENTGDSLTDY